MLLLRALLLVYLPLARLLLYVCRWLGAMNFESRCNKLTDDDVEPVEQKKKVQVRTAST